MSCVKDSKGECKTKNKNKKTMMIMEDDDDDHHHEYDEEEQHETTGHKNGVAQSKERPKHCNVPKGSRKLSLMKLSKTDSIEHQP